MDPRDIAIFALGLVAGGDEKDKPFSTKELVDLLEMSKFVLDDPRTKERIVSMVALAESLNYLHVTKDGSITLPDGTLYLT